MNTLLKKKLFMSFSVCFLMLFFSCKSLYNEEYKRPILVDKKINRSTKKLHKRLFYISKKGFAIGHQDATSYGIGWKNTGNLNTPKGDIYKLTNKLPAVYGFDLGHLELGVSMNIDSVPFNIMRKEIITAHKNGGIITVSWHGHNPVTDGDSWDQTPSVHSILKGGNNRVKYELWITRIASFIKSLKYRGENIPIIYRPFHEMNGSWFWWGGNNCDANDYIQLWQETVHLLRDKHRLHNILYVYSPNGLNKDIPYLKYYPEDSYVDILGIDIYDRENSEVFITSLINDLKLVKNIATKKNKLFAFTETGLEKIPTENWFSEVLYPNIENSGISWVLFWRNAHLGHYYIPIKNHLNEPGFKKFSNKPKTLFLKDIKN